jgi:hypothetical protein
MELNRNQFFLIGLVILMLGIQFRVVETVVLNEKATRFLAERTAAADRPTTAFAQVLPALGAPARKAITPPVWLGWCLASIGSVLILHALAMKRPDAPAA